MTSRTAASCDTSRPAPGGPRLLALAASPSFAAMALTRPAATPAETFCHAGPAGLPIDGMTAMYLLMSLFHLAPWLALAAGLRPRITSKQGE